MRRESRRHALIAVVSLAAAAGAWAWVLASVRAAPMALPGFVVAWTVMMAAMMLPSLLPSLLLFATVTRSREAFGYRPVPSVVFGAGYFATWALLGAAVGLAGQLAGPLPAAWHRAVVAGGLLLAGAYQLTRFKAWCLGHCRSPMHFFMEHWRDGPLGALRLGAHHGLYCVGCCWGLMVALIALGMMRPRWMGAIALVILAEKVLPRGQRLAPLIGLLLLAAGAGIALGVIPIPSPTMGAMHDQAS